VQFERKSRKERVDLLHFSSCWCGKPRMACVMSKRGLKFMLFGVALMFYSLCANQYLGNFFYYHYHNPGVRWLYTLVGHISNVIELTVFFAPFIGLVFVIIGFFIRDKAVSNDDAKSDNEVIEVQFNEGLPNESD
jgi:hypothetical protein